MRKRIVYKLGSLARLPLVVVTDSSLAIYDGLLDVLAGPTQYGSRAEIRRWSKTVKQIDRLEQSNTKSSSGSDKLKFGQGRVVNHLAEMNRKAGDTQKN